MECTQRLECTQELYSTQNGRQCADQIGFLGICGTKYVVKRGPNKVGRDPQTCSIVLNLSSVSRQHAVINILNKKDFMLMDLDSANKTKLSGQTLPPYIPHPLHNGDTVQFGEIFGIFRLLEEEDDLPTTQALDIPDTPLPMKHVTRVNAITTIPESPDVSDRDDSFIVPSQPKGQPFHSPKTRNFIKPGRTISIQPIGTNKIDNIYWNSSKKSTSFNLDDSNSSLNDSIRAVKIDEKDKVVPNIHELETQEFFPEQKVTNDSTGSIYTANTQGVDDVVSIHEANTQIPAGSSLSIHSLNTQMPWGLSSPSVHSLNTQMPGASPPINTMDTQPPPGDNLPEVCKINEQQDMQFDLCANKSNNDSIYVDEAQIFPAVKDNIPNSSSKINNSPSSRKLNTSNEEVLFDEIDNQSFEEGFESQPILSEDIILPLNGLVEPDIDSQSQIVRPKSTKRNMRIKSDSSGDCEDIDILPTQNILEKKCDDDDSTDCEEEKIDIITDKTKTASSKPTVNLEEMATQVIELDEAPSKTNKDVNFEDMPTQVLDVDAIENDAITEKENLNTDLDFEDLPTQVLDEDIQKKIQYNTHKFSNEEDISPFKVPFTSPLKNKKYLSNTPKIKPIANINKTNPSNINDDNYYLDTQDIFDDLCTQKLDSPEEVPNKAANMRNIKSDEKVSSKTPHTEKETSNTLVLDTSFSTVDAEEGVTNFISNLSSQEVRDVIGVDSQVTKVMKIPSDGSTASDVEITPKKLRKFKFDTELPNSQEIKTSVSINTRSLFTESSSESDAEINSEDQCTPILFRKKKKKPKSDAKIDLTKIFDVGALPSRVITRVRKPTAKIKEQESKKTSMNILKPTYLSDQEGDVDKELITENISRLKSKNEKLKNSNTDNETNKDLKLAVVVDESIADESVKRERDSRNKPEKEDKGNLENHLPEKAKDSCIDVKIKKGEPKNDNQESLDYRNEFLTTSKSTKISLDDTIESKAKHTSIKSKEIETLDLTESPIETKRNTRRPRNVKTKDKPISIENKSPSTEQDSQTEKPNRRKYTRKQRPKDKNKKELTPESQSDKLNTRKYTRKQELKVESNKNVVKELTPEPKGQTDKPNTRKYTRKQELKLENNKDVVKELTSEPESQTDKPNTRKYTRKQEPKLEKNIDKAKELTSESESQTDKPNTRKYTRKQELEVKNKKEPVKDPSPDIQTDKTNKRKHTRKRVDIIQENEKEQTPEKETRRSKRQRTVKENTDETIEPLKFTKSILKNSIPIAKDESAVYNTSSGSNSDNSRSLKRPTLDDSDVPNAKRTRSVVVNNTKRATPARIVKTQYVLFTAFPYEAVKVKLEKMGAVVVTDVMQSTVLLTRQIKRTFKLLCAVGLGKPIVGPDWVQACADSNMIVDPWLYLMKDEAAEKRFHFSLQQTLTGKRDFLQGYNVSSTPKVMPQAHEMKLIVECSGGTWKEGGSKWICVSVPDDMALWPGLRKSGAIVVSTEFILGGVLRQTVDIELSQYK